jgi:hypothetical protein
LVGRGLKRKVRDVVEERSDWQLHSLGLHSTQSFCGVCNIVSLCVVTMARPHYHVRSFGLELDMVGGEIDQKLLKPSFTLFGTAIQ